MTIYFKKSASAILVLCFAFQIAFSSETYAKEKRQDRGGKYECHLITRSEAIERAKSKVKGKIVGVQLKKRGPRSVYRVRMLVNKKRIKTVTVNGCL